MAEKKDKKLTTASFDITDKAKRFAEEYVYNDGSKTKEECAILVCFLK